jgi:hypothetical protein
MWNREDRRDQHRRAKPVDVTSLEGIQVARGERHPGSVVHAKILCLVISGHVDVGVAPVPTFSTVFPLELTSRFEKNRLKLV